MADHHFIPYDLIAAHAERSYDHERDVRPESTSLADCVLALTNVGLANLRGLPCMQCDDRDCLAVHCDRCGRHAHTLVETRPGVERIVCARCCDVRECSSCAVELPRWKMANEGGDLFCGDCAHRDPTEGW